MLMQWAPDRMMVPVPGDRDAGLIMKCHHVIVLERDVQGCDGHDQPRAHERSDCPTGEHAACRHEAIMSPERSLGPAGN
jgi:hypothetical protein